MSKLPWTKNLHLCLPNFKCLPLIPPQPSDQDHPHPHPPLVIINNFMNTLYHDSNSSDQSTSKSLTASSDFFYYSSDSDSEAADSQPDFATIFASQRFFFSSPGRSNSIVESPDSRPNNNNNNSFVTRGVSVAKYSSNPYLDFRNSMEEMLGARDGDNRDNKDKNHNVVDGLKSDLEYLHELLLCYLQLNPEDAHKDIMSAFTDLVICILSAKPAPSTSATPDDEHNLEGEEYQRR
ncbi:hypothetical protein M0R45_020512 [Rubus argutus]|uniref:Transcription repressor n=1 Tax=Rubus argutus TaxID=59490 RepID=A0AAW1XAW8_RUBAR